MAKKIRLLFDIDALAGSNKSGVGFYTYEFLCALTDYDPTNIEIVCHYFDFLGRNNPDLPKKKNIKYRRSIFIHRKVANLLRRMNLPLPIELLAKQRFDFIIYPNILSRYSLFKTPYTAVIHDLAYLDQPDTLSDRNKNDLEKFVPKTIFKSCFIITISRFTKKRVQNVFSQYSRPILVGHIPPRRMKKISRQNKSKLLAELKISKSYVLCLGTIEPRKNLDRLINAYALLPKNDKDKYSLVLAGGYGWGAEETISLIKSSQLKGLDIIKTGYISDDARDVLLQNANLVIQPSIYEGYGMPLVEAMSAGRVVIASKIPVFNEITGGNLQYFDPYIVKDISKKITEALNNKALRKKQELNNKNFVKKISWDNLVKEVVDLIYKELNKK